MISTIIQIASAAILVTVLILQNHFSNKKLKQIATERNQLKKLQIKLQVRENIWHMELMEVLTTNSLSQELSDAQKLLEKAIAEERYEDAADIQHSINKYLNKLNKAKGYERKK